MTVTLPKYFNPVKNMKSLLFSYSAPDQKSDEFKALIEYFVVRHQKFL